MKLYDSGVLIWNNETQSRVTIEQRSALLQRLLGAGFPAFNNHYGGKKTSTATGAPVIVLCSIAVQANGLEKSSYQDANGERSEVFMGLASELLDQAGLLASGGVTAASLTDGLDMLSSGELAVEALSLHLLHMPADESRPGTLISIESGRMDRRAYRPGVQVGEKQSVILGGASLQAFLAATLQADLPSMPASLPAEDVYQLKVQVLNHRISVRARPQTQAASASEERASARLSRYVVSLEQTE